MLSSRHSGAKSTREVVLGYQVNAPQILDVNFSAQEHHQIIYLKDALVLMHAVQLFLNSARRRAAMSMHTKSSRQ